MRLIVWLSTPIECEPTKLTKDAKFLILKLEIVYFYFYVYFNI